MSKPFSINPMAGFLRRKRLTNPAVVSSRPYEGDIEDLLDSLCTPASSYSSKQDPNRPVTIERCNEITDLLSNQASQIGDHRLLTWSERPRIYIVLRNIHRLDLMDEFVAADLTDFHIPFNQQTLPAFCDDETLREEFIRFQTHVLASDAKGLDDPGGPHLPIAGNAEKYFYHKKFLGQGGYGVVTAVMSRLSLKSYACKRVPRGKDTQINRQGQLYLIRELNHLKRLSHRHLVRYVASYTDERHIAFLMQPVADYDLEKLMHRISHTQTGIEALRPLYGCLAGAIQYLHENKIRHRDLKSRNILVKDGRVFIADFGTAYSWKGTRRSITNTRNVPHTPEYIAPEVAHRKDRSTASDMWSLGVVFLEMSTVLMGSSVARLQAHIRACAQSRGNEPYLWADIGIIDEWIQKLSSRDVVHEHNLEPLTWVRDLLQDKPDKRLKAADLMKQILESPSFHSFCCVDCRSDYEMQSFAHSHRTLDEQVPGPSGLDAVYDQVNALLEDPAEEGMEPEKHKTIETWLEAVHDDEDSILVGGAGAFGQSGPRFDVPIVRDDSSTMDGPWISPNPHEALTGYSEYLSINDDQSLYESLESASDTTIVASNRPDDPFQHDQGDAATNAPPEVYDATIPHDNIWSFAEVEANVWADDTYSAGSDSGYVMPPATPIPPAQDTWADERLQPWETTSPITPKYHQNEAQFGVWWDTGASNTMTSEKEIASSAPPILSPSEDGDLDSQPSGMAVSDALDLSDEDVLSDGSHPSCRFTVVSDIEREDDIHDSATAAAVEGSAIDSEMTAVSISTDLQDRNRKVEEQNESYKITSTDQASNPLSEPPSSKPRKARKPKRSVTFSEPPATKPKTSKKPKSTEEKEKSISTFSPQVYMDTAWEAASTQATSIMPLNTRNITMWRWWDRDYGYLESFCTEGNVRGVRILLDQGCNPGTILKPRRGPLLRAIRGRTYQHYKCVRELISHDVDLNITEKGGSRRTALQIAIEQPYFNGHTNLVRDLLSSGADANQPDRNGNPAIISIFGDRASGVMAKHRLDALACLLRGGHLGETKVVGVYHSQTRDTPLHLAVRCKSPMAVGMLLYRGADVNAKNQTGATPLLLAAAQWSGRLPTDQETILDLLLQRSEIDIDAMAGVPGRTALHQAVSRASPSAVTMLLQRGASGLVKDGDGKMAMNLAKSLDGDKWKDERAEIIRLLAEEDKKPQSPGRRLDPNRN